MVAFRAPLVRGSLFGPISLLFYLFFHFEIGMQVMFDYNKQYNCTYTYLQSMMQLMMLTYNNIPQQQNYLSCIYQYQDSLAVLRFTASLLQYIHTFVLTSHNATN